MNDRNGNIEFMEQIFISIELLLSVNLGIAPNLCSQVGRSPVSRVILKYGPISSREQYSSFVRSFQSLLLQQFLFFSVRIIVGVSYLSSLPLTLCTSLFYLFLVCYSSLSRYKGP